ncbi:MAG: hypothetical protein ACREV1_11235 [Gammaproteobacteria bacterium]
MLVADMVAALVSLEFAFFLTGGGRLDLAGIPGFWGLLALTALACGMIFVATGIYRRRPLTASPRRALSASSRRPLRKLPDARARLAAPFGAFDASFAGWASSAPRPGKPPRR